MRARGQAKPTLVRRALGGHAAIGLLASALLYLIALTGSLAVVHDQWTRWERPDVPEMASLSHGSAAAALSAAARGARPTTLTLQLPTADLPRAVVTTERGGWYVDRAGRPTVARQEGWSEFVVDLHETLHLPATWGLIVVGALGVALIALTLTGVLAHPRLVRDAFCLRTRHDPQIARVDWHNRLGVWTVPFVLAVALTGAFLGLSSVGTTLMAREQGGDAQRVYAPVFGQAAAIDPAPAPLPDVAAALRTLAARRPQARPSLVVIRGAGTRGQDIQIYAVHPRRLIFGESYLFDARGGWKGAAGLADGTVGQQVAASTYDLHFGNFAGPLVEIAYVALGLCLCGVIATGTTIWLHKRRSRGHHDEGLGACWTVVVWGTPTALLACLGVRTTLGPVVGLGQLFWWSVAAGLALALARPTLVSDGWLRATTAGLAAPLGVLHLVFATRLTTGPALIDAAGVALAVAIVLAQRRKERSRKLRAGQ